jgi:hypothetical protein
MVTLKSVHVHRPVSVEYLQYWRAPGTSTDPKHDGTVSPQALRGTQPPPLPKGGLGSGRALLPPPPHGTQLAASTWKFQIRQL